MRILRRFLLPGRSVGSQGFLKHGNRWDLHQLDVRVETEKTRKLEARRRFFLAVRTLLLAALLVGLGVAGKRGYDRIFYDNGEFKLTRLGIDSDGKFSETEISGVGGVTIGMDLMEVDLDEVCQRIEALPGVGEAVVKRELPDTLLIRVRERHPVAWLSSPPHGIRPRSIEHGFLLDAEGNVFRCLEMTGTLRALPVVDALDIDQPSDGELLESESIQRGLDLIHRSEQLFEGQNLEIAEVKLVKEWALECVCRDGMTVTFDKHEVERGLMDLFAIVEKMRDSPLKLATVNLGPSRNIPVTFQGDVDVANLPIQDKPAIERGAGESFQGSPQAREPEKEKEKHLRSILKGG